MLKHLQKLSRTSREVGIPIIASVVLVSLLRISGALQFLELAALDLLFVLRPAEQLDERIVLVTIEESDLQILEESVLSDRSLVALLRKILSHSPKAIGLNLYRDLPEPSPNLSDTQNEKAYQELQQVYRSNPNLIGIEKVVAPKVRAPKTLKEIDQVSGSDLLLDPDGIVRRGYIYPHKLDGSPESQIPGLGFALAYKYLEAEGIRATADKDGWVKLKETTLLPFTANDGGYVRADELGYQLLVNWRGENAFTKKSVSEVLSDRISPVLFRERIVLIGNTSSSSGDFFQLASNRWNPENLVDGVEIHAHLASSIISSVLEDRPLLRVLSEGWEYAGLFLAAGVVVAAGQKWRNSSLKMRLLLTGGITLSMSILVVGSSYLLFLEGWWLPAVPWLLGIGVALVSSNVCIQILPKKQSESFQPATAKNELKEHK